MKRSVLIVLSFFVVSFIFAQEGYNIVESYRVGPDCIYTHYYNSEVPRHIYVTSVDLNNPYISLESVQSNDHLLGFETTSSMSKRTDEEGHRSVCAVNSDFFSMTTGYSCSPAVVNGEITHSRINGCRGFAYTDDRKASIFKPSFSAYVMPMDQGSNYTISTVNRELSADQIGLYNYFLGARTGTTIEGVECVLTAISDWAVNDTVLCVVDACDTASSNHVIPEGKVVLSGNGIGAEFLRSYCQVGDTVKILQSFSTTFKKKITQYVGGITQLLSNGQNVVAEMGADEYADPNLIADQHPRTSAGFNSDSTIAYFVVVDGRQMGFSFGMSMYELADFMKQIGIANAVNFDGGGSSAMVIRNSVMNRPSDGTERVVSNSLICHSSAPTGSFSNIQLRRDSLNVYKNNSVDLHMSGWDEYFNPCAISWDELSVSYDTTLGSFDNNIFTAAENDGDCYLATSIADDKDTVVIHIIGLYDLEVYPETATIDSVNGVKFEVKAVNEAGSRTVYKNSIFNYSVLDPAIASVDEEGRVIGKVSGETKIIVSYGDQRDTAIVKVEIGEGEVVVDEIESLTGWNLSGDSNINMSATAMSLVDRTAGTGSKAIRVDYDHTSNVDGFISITCEPVSIYGVPSYILVDVLADGQKNWIYIDLQDARGEDYCVKCPSSLTYNDGYRTQYLDMANLLPSDGDQLYPIKVMGVRLRIDNDATSGSICVDRIRLIYPGWTAIDDDPVLLPGTHLLRQNYPNPFNPVTVIGYELGSEADVNLSVFDLKGKKVRTLISGMQNGGSHHVSFDASMLPGGVYFYRLQAGNWCDTKKLLLIK